VKKKWHLNGCAVQCPIVSLASRIVAWPHLHRTQLFAAINSSPVSGNRLLQANIFVWFATGIRGLMATAVLSIEVFSLHQQELIFHSGKRSRPSSVSVDRHLSVMIWRHCKASFVQNCLWAWWHCSLSRAEFGSWIPDWCTCWRKAGNRWICMCFWYTGFMEEWICHGTYTVLTLPNVLIGAFSFFFVSYACEPFRSNGSFTPYRQKSLLRPPSHFLVTEILSLWTV
jgi:hypothetical protein